jgi:glycosyltransferase involved in cell wall biosynthesis
MELRVALDARGLQPGFKSHLGRGIGRYSKNLIRAMLQESSGIEFHLLLQSGLEQPDLPSDLPRIYLPHVPAWLPGDKRLFDYHVLPSLKLPGLARRVDLVHFLSHLDAPAMLRVPAVITVHDLIFQRLRDLYRPAGRGWEFDLKRWLETRCLSRARHFISVSRQTARDLSGLYDISQERITVIEEGPDPDLKPLADPDQSSPICERLGLTQPFFLYLGGIDARKGMQYLMEALAILRDRDLPCHLALAGSISKDAKFPALREHISHLGLGNQVHMLGFVRDEYLPALFHSCLAFVFPSEYEGFGLPPLEAMTCGAPVIATNTSAVPEVVGDAGMLVEARNSEALADAMAGVARDPKLRQSLCEKGLKRAAQFNWQKAARKTLKLYKECLG